VLLEVLETRIHEDVRRALEEDIGSGDITAGLLPADKIANAQVICRDPATLCGKSWFNSVFHRLDESVQIDWQYNDGDEIPADALLCSLHGPVRALLSGERTALNFLQTLSATATTARRYAQCVEDLDVRILDTRKTIPGLRHAQKYAVTCGGCHNHRVGLYDAFLIKENHIAAVGSITRAVQQARNLHADVTVEVETETLDEVAEAMRAGADRIMLDNFELEALREAVALVNGACELEASGGISLDNLRTVAKTGVDFISIGVLTRDIHSIDLSMRLAS